MTTSTTTTRSIYKRKVFYQMAAWFGGGIVQSRPEELTAASLNLLVDRLKNASYTSDLLEILEELKVRREKSGAGSSTYRTVPRPY